jgi:hypothetical protein
MTSLAISVRELSTPCHLAHGLLDYAQYLTRTRDAEGAAAAIKEARAIAGRLRCQPLLDRAADIAPAKSVVQDQVAAVPDLEEPTGPAGVTPAAAPRLRRTGHVQNDPYGPRIWPRASRSLGYRTAAVCALLQTRADHAARRRAPRITEPSRCCWYLRRPRVRQHADRPDLAFSTGDAVA